MSDLIERQTAIDAINSMFAPTPTQMDMKEDCLEIIENLPSAQPERTNVNLQVEKLSKHQSDFTDLDAQPDIIACGDCKYWICHDRRCGYWNHGVKPMEWCCHAERNDNG